jgi:hypothetical protein
MMANDEGIVWDSPDDEITWDEPATPKRPTLTLPQQPLTVLEKYQQGVPQDMEQPLEPKVTDFLHGAATTIPRMMQTVDQAAVGLANKLGGNAQTAVPEVYEAGQVPDTPAGRAGSFAGDVAAGFIIPGGQRTALARTLAAIGGNSVVGAALNPDDVAEGAKMGAIGGAAGQAVGRLVGGIVHPTDAAKTLQHAGVALTPGQAAGIGSTWNGIEQKLTSFPIAGQVIAAARQRGVNEANVAAANAVVKHVGGAIDAGATPREAIEAARDAYSKAYTDALEGVAVHHSKLKDPLNSALWKVADGYPMVTAAQFKKIVAYVEGRVGNLANISKGTLTGVEMKQLDSEIGQHVRNLYSSTNAADKTAAPAWAEIQTSLREVLANAVGKDTQKGKALDAANGHYRELLALEKALQAGADSFTPRQLANQVGKMNLSKSDLGKVSRAMTETLPNTIPNSGTADRLLMQMFPALLAGGGMVSNEMGVPYLGTALIATGALGTRTGAKLLTGGYNGKQAALAAALRRGTVAGVGGKQEKKK